MPFDPLNQPFTAAEFERRHQALRAVLQEVGAKAAILFGNRGSHHEVLHYGGFQVSNQAVLVFPAAGEPILLVHFPNHVAQARQVAVVPEVRPLGDDAVATVLGCLHELGLATAAIGLAGPVSYQRHGGLARELGADHLIDLSPRLTAARLVKSDEEIALIRRGAALSDAALGALVAEAQPGLSETELVAILQSAYVPSGGQTHIHFLGSTSMASPDLRVPRQLPTGRRLASGDVILTELSAFAAAGCYGQVLRTITVASDPTPQYVRMHEVAVQVFEALAGLIRAGTSSEEVLEVAEEIHRAGFTIDDDLVHTTVGGVYQPYVRTRPTGSGSPPFQFTAGQVIVIQPNVVTLDGQAGVQFGEMFVVRPDGLERLQSTTRRLLRAG